MDPDLRPFVDSEGHNHIVDGNLLGGDFNFRILVSFFGQQGFDEQRRPLSLGFVIWRLLAERGFLLPELVDNVGLCEGLQALVFNLPDVRSFLHPEGHDDALFSVFRIHFDVIDRA